MIEPDRRPDVQIGVRIRAHQNDEMMRVMARTGVSMAQIVRNALDHYFETKRPDGAICAGRVPTATR